VRCLNWLGPPPAGPPYCHLHAGGFLYVLRIPVDEAISLLHDSLEFARRFPDCIIFRPTFVALRAGLEAGPARLAERASLVEQEYQRILKRTAKGAQLFGSAAVDNPQQICRVYSEDEARDVCASHANSLACGRLCLDCFLVNALAHIEWSRLQWPVVMAWEPGVSFVRVGATLETHLSLRSNVHVRKETEVINVACLADHSSELSQLASLRRPYRWGVRMRCEGPEEKEEVEEQFDVVINCAGSDAASIDLLARPARVNEDYFREIKACFVLSMSHSSSDIVTNISSTSHATSFPSTSMGKSIGMEVPEIVLLGDRGEGELPMLQITPWGDGILLVHAMSSDATLFANGCKAGVLSACGNQALDEFESEEACSVAKVGWDEAKAAARTLKARDLAAECVPSVAHASVAGAPLWGVQLIPSASADQRVASLSFPLDDARGFGGYARVSIVKGISAVGAARRVLAWLEAAVGGVPHLSLPSQAFPDPMSLPVGIDAWGGDSKDSKVTNEELRRAIVRRALSVAHERGLCRQFVTAGLEDWDTQQLRT